jgi:hypothetical protein
MIIEASIDICQKEVLSIYPESLAILPEEGCYFIKDKNEG